jgi:FixJ family two-component response regulator
MLTNVFDVSTHPLYHVFPVLFQMIGSQFELKAGAQMSRETRRVAAATAVKALSRRQREVLAEMALGHLNRHIALRLGISKQTVKMHRALLMERLGAATSADAIRIAVEAGL